MAGVPSCDGASVQRTCTGHGYRPRPPLPRFGGNTQAGCGLAVREIRGHRYLYFWAYERGPGASRRLWTYVGRVGRPETARKARDLLLVHHLRARRELDRRIGRLLASRDLGA